MNNELWRETSVSGYEVSNYGRIRNSKTGYVRRIKMGKLGYYNVNFYVSGKQISLKAHRLVAEAFISNKENKPFVNHKDGNKINNNVDNLEWCTSSENISHAFNTGLKEPVRGSKHGRSKLNESDVYEMLQIHAQGNTSQKQLAELYKVSTSLVSLIIKRQNWKHVK